MKCSLCGCEFEDEKAQSACRSCYIMKGCKLVRCPRCGFEMVPEPRWFKNIKKRRRSDGA